MCKMTLNISESVKEICLKTEWRRASLGHFVVNAKPVKMNVYALESNQGYLSKPSQFT